MSDQAVAMKDRLLGEINGIGTPAEAIRYADVVAIPLFRDSEALWVELRYAYKAAEILDRLQHTLQTFADEAKHWRTCAKLTELTTKIRIMADRYRFLQQQSFWAEAPTPVVC